MSKNMAQSATASVENCSYSAIADQPAVRFHGSSLNWISSNPMEQARRQHDIDCGTGLDNLAKELRKQMKMLNPIAANQLRRLGALSK
jgi:hypothetical protein